MIVVIVVLLVTVSIIVAIARVWQGADEEKKDEVINLDGIPQKWWKDMPDIKRRFFELVAETYKQENLQSDYHEKKQ